MVIDAEERSGGRLPAGVEELCQLSATEALLAFRERRLSPVELMAAVIERAERRRPDVNAFVHPRYEEALDAARAAEARYAGRSRAPRPLEGLPVAVKEETAIAGQPWTLGSLALEDGVADHTAVCVERVLRAGGIVHVRTTTPEFSCMPYTHSRLWGVTRNPWNLEFSPGGSSGGSGAALAAGAAPLATGSDIGGSLRIPASFCGVVAFKPPYGRIPEEPIWNLDDYVHEGAMARSVGDCLLLHNVMAGPHPSDVVSLRPKLTIPRELGGIEGWHIAFSPTLGGYDVDDEIVASLRETASALAEAGAIVEEVDLPWDPAVIVETAMVHLRAIFGASMAELFAAQQELLSPYVVHFAAGCDQFSATAVLRGMAAEGAIYRPLGRLLQRYRVLICPTVATTGLVAGDDYIDHGPDVNGRPAADLFTTLLTIPFNIASRCPVLAVPSGVVGNGVPTGVQVVGRTYDDVSVFRVGRALELARPWPTLAPLG